MSYIILQLVSFFMGFFIGQHFLKKEVARNIVDDPDKFINAIHDIKCLQNVLDEDLTEVTVENHIDSFYIYDKETSLFLGQGSTLEDAMTAVTDRFPNTKFVYVTD